MARIKQITGLTVAAGLLASGCTSPDKGVHPAASRPNFSAECVPTGYTEHFVGYWALHMNGLRVAREDKQRAAEVLRAALAQAQTLRTQGYGGIQLLGVVTHGQYRSFATEKGPGTIGATIQADANSILRSAGSVLVGAVDTGVATAGPHHNVDPSVPVPTSATAYVQATNTVPAATTCG